MQSGESVDRSPAELGTACRSVLVRSLKDIAERGGGADGSTRALILSGGVDTSAIAEAAKEAGISFRHAITVLAGDPEAATDRPYASKIAQLHNLEHHVVEISLDDLMGKHLEFCVKTLETFDGMQLRNSMVVAAALHKAKSLGMERVVTGDAADELLGGYSFTWGSEDPVWSQKRAEMCSEWTFTCPTMAKALSMVAESPYMEPGFVDWALATTKKECIYTGDIEAYPGMEREPHVAGKMPLRNAYGDAVSAWRRKDPIEKGSGSTMLSNKDFWTGRVGAEELAREKERILKEDKVTIRDEEHLINYRAFVAAFPSGLPGRERHGKLPCVGCGYALKHDKALFCHVCGAWPAQEVKKDP